MKAFQEALVHDLDADGFADMYAQTIAYGLLSARIADPHKKTADDLAGHMRTNPFLRELMETFLKVGGRRGKAGGPGIDFDELGVSEVVELLDDANMEAVVRDFGDRNPQEDPVIHFYELFLSGVRHKKQKCSAASSTPRARWSPTSCARLTSCCAPSLALPMVSPTPRPGARWSSSHEGLADPAKACHADQDFVQILDPATGTGTFLVEVIDVIHKTLVAKWKAQGHGEKKIEALWNDYVPKHLLPRLHGYELLMAPYAIAHLKIGLKLYETGYRFGSDERARIYLTNALEPASDLGQLKFDGLLSALAHEAEAVNEVKRARRFTVVVGNPPYSVISGNLTPSQRSLIDAYRNVDGVPIRERSMLRLEMHLQDDYVKFMRLCEIEVRATGSAVLGLITNSGYLDSLSLRGLRSSLMRTFSRLSLLNLHGSRQQSTASQREQGDENVFDIEQGVAVLIAARPPATRPTLKSSTAT